MSGNEHSKFEKMLLRRIIELILLPVMLLGFGKNKVQYREFDWKYVQSKHFDVYYYGGTRHLATFCADVAESSYVALKRDFKHDIQDRIPILIYNTHNEFQQTNVTYSHIEESVGGFTEVFKDRIVIPFQGSYEDFRHVIHHELTHAVMFQIFYGGGVGSVVTGMARFQVPLWLAEGLAEYESLGWDTKSDMFMRDATLHGYVPPIDYMSGFMVYKGGQSLMNYIAEKYGSPKIGEMIGKIRVARSINRGLKQTLGMDTEELSKRWHKYLRKRYWPDIQGRDEPEDIAKQLTDHVKKRHFLNGSPSLSPKGDKLVYLSDQSDYIDIHLMRTVDNEDMGKLIKGQRSDLFEQLHWLRPGMDWSPDGDRIVFAAKGGGRDVLYILDVKTREILQQYEFDLDGMYSPSWSHDGEILAFMGLEGGQSDIYLFRLSDERLERLTDDLFSDMDPTWSPSGRELVFVSDRGDYLNHLPDDLEIQNHDYRQYDLYVVDIENKDIHQLTREQVNVKSPVFSPEGDKIAYVSDRSGIDNIYIFDRNTDESYAITNLVTGISQLSWSRDGSRMAFTGFYEGGYDIYMMTHPLDIEPGSVMPMATAFVKEKHEEIKKTTVDATPKEESMAPPGLGFQHFVFDDRFRKGEVNPKAETETAFLDSSEFKENGEYITKDYKIRFTPDVITGGAGYSQFWGLQGSSMIVFSDLLGNHQISLYTDLFYNFKNSNFQVGYFYLPRRVDIGGAVFHFSYPYYYSYYELTERGYELRYEYIRTRNYGLSLASSRPFDRYRRMDANVTFLGIDQERVAIDPLALYWQTGKYEKELGVISRRRVVLMNLGYTTDTVLWGTVGPINGGRSNIQFTYSPLIRESTGLDFWTVRGDVRRYLRLGRDYTFALRLAGGMSGGKNQQHFFLGGMSNWINYQYNRSSVAELSMEELFFFSSFETPLRGFRYYEMIGTRFMLANVEFRFPLIRYLILGWPLPLGFQNVRGVLFTDLGSAWDVNKAWKPVSRTYMGDLKLNDLKAGFGFGFRLNMGFLLIRYDAAWNTNIDNTSNKPMHYFTLGAEF
ncbi:PD40 domain-containing protein [bacterium]|nr:PD40 domain-containing protein [bacterium]